jgi:hypothetical protein
MIGFPCAGRLGFSISMVLLGYLVGRLVSCTGSYHLALEPGAVSYLFRSARGENPAHGNPAEIRSEAKTLVLKGARY